MPPASIRWQQVQGCSWLDNWCWLWIKNGCNYWGYKYKSTNLGHSWPGIVPINHTKLLPRQYLRSPCLWYHTAKFLRQLDQVARWYARQCVLKDDHCADRKQRWSEDWKRSEHGGGTGICGQAQFDVHGDKRKDRPQHWECLHLIGIPHQWEHQGWTVWFENWEHRHQAGKHIQGIIRQSDLANQTKQPLEQSVAARAKRGRLLLNLIYAKNLKFIL